VHLFLGGNLVQSVFVLSVEGFLGGQAFFARVQNVVDLAFFENVPVFVTETPQLHRLSAGQLHFPLLGLLGHDDLHTLVRSHDGVLEEANVARGSGLHLSHVGSLVHLGAEGAELDVIEHDLSKFISL